MIPSETDWVMTFPFNGTRREFVSPIIGLMHSFAYWRRFRKTVPSDRPFRIVDVGACIGGFSVPLLEPWKNASVDAFEPWESCWEYLEHNTKGLRVYLHKEAVAAGSKEIVLSYDERFNVMGCPSVYGNGLTARTVKAVALDDVIHGQLDLLKVDVEGYELEVLKGATRILTEVRPMVVLEIKGVHQSRAGLKPGDLIDYMLGCGYNKMSRVTSNDYVFEYEKTE